MTPESEVKRAKNMLSNELKASVDYFRVASSPFELVRNLQASNIPGLPSSGTGRYSPLANERIYEEPMQGQAQEIQVPNHANQ